MRQSNRREFLLAASACAAPAWAAAKEIRVAVLGVGSRGVGLMRHSLEVSGVRVTAVCDIDEARATRAQEIVEKATGSRPAPYTRGPEDYRRMLERQDVDVVLIMTYQDQHAPQAIHAMEAGKHVGSETPSAYTIDECWALVEAKEKSERRYSLLENYPYSRTRMMILNMAHRGVMGEITYGESSYIHDTRNLAYDQDGALSWRGRIAQKHRGDVYPTHALGPVSLWMGMNRGDRLASMVSMDTGTRNLETYARDRFGKSHAAAQPSYFQKRDTTITLVRSANERLIVLRYDSGSNRPAGGWEQLQGTRGAYDGSPGAELLYLEGRSPAHRWEPLDKYRAEFDHPYWKRDGAAAASAGHGGGDYFVMREFYRALAEDREPPIDVYDGASWSSILPLSGRSIRESNKSLEIPDFTRGRWKQRKLTGFGIDA
jgi:predicted dehydrogenase